MIEVQNLVKKYDDFPAVDDISFGVEKGDILGFLGPNGAGKSTTMKILSCFVVPTSGDARIFGKSVLEDSLAVRKMIGYLPESAPSYRDMTVMEFLLFVAEVRGFGGDEISGKVEEILERTFLNEVRGQTIDTLSKGFRQRVGLAQALVHDPPVLILDEPTDGLDPNQKHEVRKMIADISRDKAIILSTHIAEEMEAVCNRAVVINSGRIVADSTPKELLEKSRFHHAIQFRIDGEDEAAAKLVAGLKADFDVSEEGGGTYVVFAKNGREPFPKFNELAMGLTDRISSVHILKGKFEEVFRNLTREAAAQAGE